MKHLKLFEEKSDIDYKKEYEHYKRRNDFIIKYIEDLIEKFKGKKYVSKDKISAYKDVLFKLKR